MASSKLFRVLYDFNGEDQGELTVKAGELVMSDGTDRDGWVLVESTEGESGVGFIPTDYVDPVAPSEEPGAPSPDSAPAHSAASATPSAYANGSSNGFGSGAAAGGGSGGAAAGSGSGSGSALVAYSAEPSSTSVSDALAKAEDAQRLAALTGAGIDPSAPASENFAHLFTSHEDWFTQATQKRAETFSNLQHALDDLCRKMSECEGRNDSIVKRLSDLDSLLSDERSKWQDRVQDGAA